MAKKNINLESRVKCTKRIVYGPSGTGRQIIWKTL